MRNPLSLEKYTGPWNDQDNRWNAENKAKVNHTEADDGIFYLPVDIFHRAMPFYYEGMYQEWKESKWSNTEDGDKFVRNIHSTIPQEAVLTIDWMSNRRYPDNCGDYQKDHKYIFEIRNLGFDSIEVEFAWNTAGFGSFKFPKGLRGDYRITVRD